MAANPAPPVRATPLAHRAAATAILADGQVDLARIGGRDHVGLTQAAEEQVNQPLALTRYRTWGWVDEATRQWAAGERRLEAELLTLTSEAGARLAYSEWPAANAGALPCPPGLVADQCRLSGDGTLADLVARLGPYVFHLRGARLGLDELAAAAAAQLARLRESG